MTADSRDATSLPLRRSPLGASSSEAFAVAEASGVQIHERPFLAQVLLRMPPTPAALAAVGRDLALELPTAPNRFATSSTAAERRAFWLGPDEWLVIDRAEPQALEHDVAAASANRGGTVVDVAAHRTVLELRGAGVRDLLAAGTSVDLHPRAFAVGACAQTMLARVDVILARTDVDAYLVAVRSSFARYLADWLTNGLAGIEGVAS